MDIVMKQVTPVSREAPITFGHIKINCTLTSTTCKSAIRPLPSFWEWPTSRHAFCFPRIHSNLTGAFGLMAGGYYNLATAMVFGTTMSASSWEPFRQAIEALSVVYANRPNLVIKHKYYLKMISWEKSDPTALITQAVPCLMNKGP